jgi:hypothetical protein
VACVYYQEAESAQVEESHLGEVQVNGGVRLAYRGERGHERAVARGVEFSGESQAVRCMAASDADNAIVEVGVGGYPDLVGGVQCADLLGGQRFRLSRQIAMTAVPGAIASSKLASHASIKGYPPGPSSTQLMSAVSRTAAWPCSVAWVISRGLRPLM